MSINIIDFPMILIIKKYTRRFIAFVIYTYFAHVIIYVAYLFILVLAILDAGTLLEHNSTMK